MNLSPAHAGTLRVTLFGGPAVHCASQEVRLSAQQQAIIAIIFGHGDQGISRDRLIWLLWEQDNHPGLRHSLRQLLYATGRRIGRPLAESYGARLLANFREIKSDLPTIERPTGSRPYADAATLFNRGFLSGLDVPVSREFDDWKQCRTIGLRTTLRDAAATVWSDAEAGGDWPRARDAAEALFMLDPGSESYLRCVMKARALCGFPEQAEAAFRGWMESRGTHENIDPRTVQLLSRTSELASHFRAPVELYSRPIELPLVGRSEELSKLRGLLTSQPATVTAVILSGEPGIGKTRLLQEVARLAELEGVLVLGASCTLLGRQIPLNPLVDALTRDEVGQAAALVNEPWRSVVQQIVPALASQSRATVPAADPATTTRRLFEAIQVVLESLSSQHRLLVWIDDVQWADETTLAALEFLIRRWRGRPLFLCFAARQEYQDAPSTPDFASRIRGAVYRIHLGELSRPDAETLVRYSLGANASERSVHDITAFGTRNPFCLIELALDHSEGRAVPSHGAMVRGEIPVSIQEVFGERLTRVTASQRRTLEVLSVSGDVTVEELSRIVSVDVAEIADDLAALLALRLVRYASSLVGPAHELLRQVVYSALGPQHRAFLHCRVADVLRETARDRGIGEIAVHYDLAGESDNAVRFALMAAENSEREGSLPEAIRFLRVARRHQQDPRQAAQLLAREGQMLLHTGDETAALNALVAVEPELRRFGNDVEATLCSIHRIALLSKLAILEPRECVALLDRALEDAEKLDRWDLYLQALEAKMRILERDGDVAGVRRAARAAARIPTRSEARVTCIARSIQALDVLFGGGERAIHAAVEAARLAREAKSEALIDRMDYRLFVTLLYSGRLNLPAAPYTVQDCIALANRTADFWLRVNCYNSVACWMIDTGNLEEGRRALDGALAALGDQEEGEIYSKVLVNEAELALYLDDYDRGIALGVKALRLKYNSSLAVDKIIAQGAVGICAARSGNLSLFWQVARDFRWSGDPYFECSLPTWYYLELARARGNIDEGLAFLRRTAAQLRQRLPTTWLKLALIDLEYSWKRDPARAATLARDGKAASQRLCLGIRERQFDGWLQKLWGQGETPRPLTT